MKQKLEREPRHWEMVVEARKSQGIGRVAMR
jgi:hypothetical protein